MQIFNYYKVAFETIMLYLAHCILIFNALFFHISTRFQPTVHPVSLPLLRTQFGVDVTTNLRLEPKSLFLFSSSLSLSLWMATNKDDWDPPREASTFDARGGTKKREG